jgi:hypothetical protein
VVTITVTLRVSHIVKAENGCGWAILTDACEALPCQYGDEYEYGPTGPTVNGMIFCILVLVITNHIFRMDGGDDRTVKIASYTTQSMVHNDIMSTWVTFENHNEYVGDL